MTSQFEIRRELDDLLVCVALELANRQVLGSTQAIIHSRHQLNERLSEASQPDVLPQCRVVNETSVVFPAPVRRVQNLEFLMVEAVCICLVVIRNREIAVEIR